MKDQLLSQMKGSSHNLKAALVENFSNQIDILIQQHIVTHSSSGEVPGRHFEDFGMYSCPTADPTAPGRLTYILP